MPIRRSNLLAFYGIKEFVRESNAFRGFFFGLVFIYFCYVLSVLKNMKLSCVVFNVLPFIFHVGG